MLDQSFQVATLTPFQQVTAQLKEALRENAELKAQIKVLTAAPAGGKPKRAPKALKASGDYPPEFLAAYDAGRKWRTGSTLPAAFTAWSARIKKGDADTAATIIARTAEYAAFCIATGTEKKMAQTFFGPGEYCLAEWPIPSAPAARGGKFDPVAHVNQGSMPPQGDWFDGIIDITPR
ncbi:hypothetical protein [Duganella violaceipulchra]|uniref:Uncharacterized protein n=1 Tax=Duganella violaceipulchra TaxID=2849652 RepID=A0AA41L038_9BURK|nr:hypothetical protein [Duganella violaceicalia]MBV6321926.1 hypothetical protein [Duganella violaceicalia]MCP2007080.1 hypothetical protein [Duganella violaceicalia]